MGCTISDQTSSLSSSEKLRRWRQFLSVRTLSDRVLESSIHLFSANVECCEEDTGDSFGIAEVTIETEPPYRNAASNRWSVMGEAVPATEFITVEADPAYTRRTRITL